MISLNWSDVISVLNMCKAYLIAIAAVILIGIVVIAACRKKEVAIRKLIRGNAGIAMIVAVIVIVNLACTGPLSTLLNLAVQKTQTISDETTKQSNADCQTIAEEGIVLLKNDGLLPLKGTQKLNVFGWAGTNPIYGGSGAGALNDLYDRVSLQQGLEDAGYEVNTELTDLYTGLGAERASYGSDWSLPEVPVSDYSDELLENAKSFSDTALVVIGRWGGEGSDLPTDMTTAEYTDNSSEYADFQRGQHYLELSQTEKDMIGMVCDNFDNVVLIYNGLSTFELGFVNDYPQIKGVLWCQGAGQTGFDGLGTILNGCVNPSGKTSDTFVYYLTATPTWNNFGDFQYDNMQEFKIDESDPYVGGAMPTFVNYVEGIYVGYRYYDKAQIPVRWPFGYGLSYTRFAYSDLQIASDGQKPEVSVTVTNTGKVFGEEVVQLYVSRVEQTGIHRPVRELKGFCKVALEAGEEKCVTFSLDKRSFAVWKDRWVVEAGTYEISVADLKCRIALAGETLTAKNDDSWYWSLSGKPDQISWEQELGRTYVPSIAKKGSFTMDNTIEEMMDNSLLMKVIYQVVEFVLSRPYGGKQVQESPEFKMMMKSSVGAPLRSMQMFSGIKGGLFEGLLEIANGHLLRGIVKMIKK